MQIQKIFQTVTSASAYIEDAINTQAEGNEDKVIQFAWRAASDLEYVLFLFSLRQPEKTKSISWELPPVKQPEMESLLVSTQELLKAATKSLETDDLKEAHKKIWMARGQLFRIHDFLDKKRRKG